MKNGSKRTISRLLAFVMLVSCMFTNIITANATDGVLGNDDVLSSAAVVLSEDGDLDTVEVGTTESDTDPYYLVTGTAAGDGVNQVTYDATTGLYLVEDTDTGATTTLYFPTSVSGDKVEISGTFSPSAANNSWTLVQVWGLADGADEADGATEIAGIRTNSGTFNLRVEGSTLVDTGVAITAGETYNYTITIDNTAQTVTLDIDGSTAEGTLANVYTSLSNVRFVTATGSRNITVSAPTISVVDDNESDTEAGEAVNFELWLDDLAVDGTVATGVYTGDVTLNDGSVVSLGGSTLELQGQGDEQYTMSYSAAIGVTRAGKTVNGYKAGTRNANANSITEIPSQGDGTAIVFTPAATGMLNTYFVSTSYLRAWDFDTETGAYYTYYDSETAADSFAIAVEAGHTYVLSTTGQTNNMAYCGFEYIVDEPTTISVSYGDIDDEITAETLSSLEIYLTDADLNTVDATIKYADTTTGTTVNVYNGHTYVLSTNDGGVEATVNGSDSFTVTGEAVTIDLANIPDVTLTGEITGTPEGTVTSMTFTNMTNGSEYTAEITGSTYSVVLKPGDYNTSVETTNGGVTYDRVSVVYGEENVNEVYVEVPDEDGAATYTPANLDALEYTGTVTARDNDIAAKSGATITVPVSTTSVVTVNAYYQSSFTINGEAYLVDSGSTSQIDSFEITTSEDVVIEFTDTYSTSYITSIEVTPIVLFTSEISVPGDYDTLTEAVAAINAMSDRPDGEEGRVTINMTADIEEQVVFDAPYVTLNGNGHTLSWYYGISSYYYSIDSSTGLYSERLYRDRYEATEANSSLWGGVAIIRGDNFIAHDTTFLNTYNYYVTEKEASDIAYSVASMPERTLGADVTVYASKERSNAFYIDADNIEVYNCSILSSQDTLGRNGTTDYGYHAYFKDCVIGGNTDYICGEFTAIFDNCELQWKTYSDDASNNAKVGYITAPKTNPYIFRNCTVTTSGAEGDQTVTGYYGRTWGSNSQAYFINTETNGYILDDGWGEMSSGDGATALFYEYNNTSNGVAFVSTGEFGQVLTDEEVIANITSDNVIDVYLNGWTPVSYAYEVSSTKLWGDVNGDGSVDVLDVSLALDYTLQPESVEDFDTSAADVSGDGTINSEDVALILQKVLDSTFTLPVEEDSEDDTSEDDTETATEATTEATEGTTSESTGESAGAVTVYVVGDSTACHYGEDSDTYYWYKRVGFGDKLEDYFNDNVTVVNLALSGRSSKSFATGINENGITDADAVTNYAYLLNNISEGDYLIIAWGHNDEKTDQYRYTDPTGDINTEGSFKNSLYENYIKVAEDAGATPILCTPIIRANSSGELSDNDKHVTDAGDYGECIRELAEELNITLIDNLASTMALYEEIGAGTGPTATTEPTGYLALHAALQDLSVDTTHLNAYGASMVAYMMARDIKASDNTLSAYVADDITEPVFSQDECYNTNWQEFDESIYVPSSIWKVSDPWAGSVFGSSVGSFTEDSHPNHDIVEQGENSVRLVASNNKGKIASAEDGLVMYFQEIDADQDFEFTATAHINSYDASVNQTAFGLMLRDNMFSDYEYKTKAPYFAVGNTAQNSGKNKVSVFRRLTDGSLEQTVKETLTTDETAALFPEGTEIELKISRIDGVVTVQYGDEDAYTFNDDLCDLTTVSADYDYVGVFVSRAADVTFNNLSLTLID